MKTQVTILKYTPERAKFFKVMLKRIPLYLQDKKVIFAYGDTAFKFKHKGRTIEVSRYDEEIIIRK